MERAVVFYTGEALSGSVYYNTTVWSHTRLWATVGFCLPARIPDPILYFQNMSNFSNCHWSMYPLYIQSILAHLYIPFVRTLAFNLRLSISPSFRPAFRRNARAKLPITQRRKVQSLPHFVREILSPSVHMKPMFLTHV